MKVFTVLATLLLSAFSLGAIPANTHAADSIPSIAGYKENPYTYRYGSVQQVTIFRKGEQKYTNMLFKPMGTYLLYSESVTFCGDQNSKLNFTSDDIVVLIHSRIMHRRDCFDLLRIDVIDKVHSTTNP